MFLPFFRVFCLLCLAALSSSCTWVHPNFATVTYYDYGVGVPEDRPLDPYPVTVLVEDLRPQILTRKKIPLFVGRAENGLGEARDVLNRDDCPVPVSVHRTPHCRSLAESIRHRLKTAKTSPSPENAKGLLLLEIRQWETHAASDLELDYSLDIYLRSSSGERLGNVSLAGQGEVIDTQNLGKMNFANHEAKENQLSLLVSGVLDDKLNQLLTGSLKEALERLR